ncbi:MAG: tetratricopeptide repeat protein [Acidobacteriota bacterium]
MIASSRARGHSPPHALAALFFVALVLRIGCAVWLFPHGYFVKYPALVEDLRQGNSDRWLDGSPFYIAYHWCSDALLGDDLRWRLYGQLLVGSFSVVLIAIVGAKLLGRRAGILCGLIAAAYSGFLVYDTVFEPESWLIFLTTAWVFCLIHSDRDESTNLGSTVLAGILFGLASFTRPTGLLALPFIALYLAARPTGHRRGTHWRALVSFILPSAVSIGLLMFYGMVTAGSYAVAVMNPGEAYYEGNNPWARGALSTYPLVVKDMEMQHPARSDYAHVIYRQIARSELGGQAPPAECNRYWRTKALAFLKEYPGAAAMLLAQKMRFLVASFEAHDVEQARVNDDEIHRWPLVRFGWLAPLGFPGIVLWLSTKASKRPSGLWVPFIVLACFAISNLVFFVSARQRLHMVPPLILFAAYALCEIAGMVRKRSWARLCLALIGFGVCAGAAWPLPTAAAELNHIRSDSTAANRYYRMALDAKSPAERRANAELAVASAPYSYDRLRPAGVLYDQAFYDGARMLVRERLARHAQDLSLRFDLGIAELLAGRLAEAEASFGVVTTSGYAVYRYYFGPSSAYYYLGLCAERRGRFEDALGLYRRALDEQPGCPWSLGREADLSRRLGRSTEAERSVTLLSAIHDPATVHMSLGMAAYDARDYTESSRQFEAALRVLPDLMKARVFLAASLRQRGDPRAAAIYEDLRRFGSTLAFPEAGYP